MILSTFLNELSETADERTDSLRVEVGAPVFVATRISATGVQVFVFAGDLEETENVLAATLGTGFLIFPMGEHDGLNTEADYIRLAAGVWS